VYASWITHEEKNINDDAKALTKVKDISVKTLNEGGFSAELGIKDNEPYIFLNGDYEIVQKGDKEFIYCYGKAIIKDKISKFAGSFYGGNNGKFDLKFFVDKESYFIFGEYKLNDNGKDFQGSWQSKDKDEKGWIKGTFEEGTENNKVAIPILDEGRFKAGLGKRGNERPFIVLNGSYKTRNRYYIVSGIAEAGEHSGRFKGIFKDNRFFIRISIRGLNIFGKCRFDSEHEDFTGVWIGRNIPLRGWIKGTFD
jgi:hypothetical protein